VTELMVRQCASCGHVTWPPRLLCPACGASEVHAVAAGLGTVTERTHTRTPTGEEVVLVTVELGAGPWLVARATDAADRGDSVSLEVTNEGEIVCALPR
jgi:uncharacterized OB-fold protein